MSELSLGQLKGLTINSNKITVPSGHTLYAPGHVIQTVSSTYSTQVSSSASSWISTGITATITPKSSNSKIIIISSNSGHNTASTVASVWSLFRGDVSTGTNLGSGNAAGWGQLYSSAGSVRTIISMNYVDSPGTTSPVTYTVAFNPAGALTYANDENRRGNIILMEIAA